MNLTSGLRWPHKKGGPKDKWAILEEAGQQESRQHKVWEGQKRVSVKWEPGPAWAALRGSPSPSADAQ